MTGSEQAGRQPGGPAGPGDRGPRETIEVNVVVDVANVMGSRPDGWWRDRAAAALRLTRSLAGLLGREVDGPDGVRIRLIRLVAVVEGQARSVPLVDGVELVRANGDGDTEVVRACQAIVAGGGHPLAVTADRQLRAGLPAQTSVAGPRWLLALLE